MKCPSCGHENEGGSKFCQSCGANMEAAAQPEQTAPPSSPPPVTPAAEDAPPPPPPPPPPVQPAGQTTSTPPPSGGGGTIDMGGIISASFSEVMANIGGYILLTLAVSIVGGVTGGILAGPLMGGMFYVIRRHLRGEGQLDVGTAFNKGFEKFVPTFVFTLIVGIGFGILISICTAIPVIGWLALLVVSPAMMAFMAIGLQLIMEEDMDFSPALSETWNILSSQMVMILLFCLVLSIVSSLGAIACGIGVLVTMPVAYIGMVKMMDTLRFGE